jgi:tRNA(Ile)-lysidine synthetase, N-terminal domain/tRNA(Ile)-lysidine synthetase, C-terminal domain
VKDKVIAAIRQYDMFGRGDTIAVGVSGGADSTALLHLLALLRAEWQLSLLALHLNHRLRAEESERDERFVRDFCAALGVALAVESQPVAELARRKRISIEEAAREARYAFFEQAAPAGAQIATAHTLSDSVETMLLQLARGTGISGMKGIPPVRGRIVRPFIQVTRTEVEAYCRGNSLAFVTDSTNLSDAYSRNRIRHLVVPELQRLNPAFEQTAHAAMQSFAQDAAFLDKLAKDARKELCVEPLREGQAYSRAGYLQLAVPIASRVLRLLLQENGLACSRQRIAQLDGQIRLGSGGVELSKQQTLRVDSSCFWLETVGRPAEFFCVSVSTEDLGEGLRCRILPDKHIGLRPVDYEQFEKFAKNGKQGLKNYFDYDKIVSIVEIRQRLPGDAIALAGRGCTKTLRKLFGEAKLSDRDRRRVLVMAQPQGALLWVEGFGVSEQIAPDSGTTRIAEIFVKEENAGERS